MGAFAQAPPITEIPLELFGGTDSEIDPSDCPEGLSPDNQDVGFLPGSIFVRPGLKSVFNPFLGLKVPILYEKTYVQPNNNPLTLVLDANGQLYVEDVSNSPNTANVIGSVIGGLYAQSVSAFGREYIAFSDLLHGQDVALQYDGTNLDRVTQDGPGAGVSAADENLVYTIAASATGLTILSFNIESLSEAGHVVTVNIPSAIETTYLQVGDTFVIAGATVGAYNGTWNISAILPNTAPAHAHFQFIHPQTGLAGSGAAGTVKPYLAELQTTTANAFTAGISIVIAGATAGGWDQTAQIRTIIDTQNSVIVINTSGLSNSGGGTATIAGSVPVGVHKVCVMFLTRQGYITHPSPITSWTSAGSLRVIIADLPIGPANIVARIIAFTGAGGGDFFFIPNDSNLPGATPVHSTVIRDNTTTSATIDFSDNALFAAIPIDVVGNDLFDQEILGTPMGFFAFASRLMTWGDWNKVENFLNMGFEGGYLASSPTSPLGWRIDAAGGQLGSGGSWADGQLWQIIGDGTSNDIGSISQPAATDEFGDAIIQPDTQYRVRLWAQRGPIPPVPPPGVPPPVTGNIKVTLSSVSASFTATALIPAASLALAGKFYSVLFDQKTPATIPSDLRLGACINGVTNLLTISFDELEIIFDQNPYRDTLSQVSYVNNPEAFALTTGNLGAEDDQSPIRCFSLQRNNALLKTAEGVHEFTDNDGEPGTWVVNAITRAVGAMSIKSADPGKFGSGDAAEDWDVVADPKGLYLFAGGDHWKISQEYQSWWDRINSAAMHTVVTKNDPHLRRIYCAVPIDGATTPNIIFVVDYRELDTAVQIAGAAPLHITLQGMMKSSDLTRKWTRWNLAMNAVELLVRPNNKIELCLGGNFGNIYTLDASKKTDDDYGQKSPYYDTYGFISHDQEQQFQLGAGVKDYRTVQLCVTGHGLISFIPMVNSRSNPLPQSSRRQLISDADIGTALHEDWEWTSVGISGNRVFFRVQIDPLPGETDVDFNLKKMVVGMSKSSTNYRRTNWL